MIGPNGKDLGELVICIVSHCFRSIAASTSSISKAIRSSASDETRSKQPSLHALEARAWAINVIRSTLV
jgi:hypothetical protein